MNADLYPNWLDLLQKLVAENRRFEKETDHAVCVRLAPELRTASPTPVGWTPGYLWHVLHPEKRSKVNSASPLFKEAVINLWKSAHKKKRKRGLRLYIPMGSRDEVEYIEKFLTPGDRRDVLLAAASHEDL